MQVLFKNSSDEVIAFGLATKSGTSVATTDIPGAVKEAHCNAMQVTDLLTKPRLKFQEVNMGVDDELYRRMYSSTSNAVKQLKERHPKAFTEHWNRDWITAEVNGRKIWRRDLEAVNAGKLSEEEFFGMIGNSSYLENPEEFRREYLSTRHV